MAKIKKMIRNFFILLDDLLRSFIIYLPGHLGRKLRYFYYKRKFKKCGKNVKIDEGVIIEGPEWISIGDNVLFDKYCLLTAGKNDLTNKIVKIRENKDFTAKEGELIIGSGVHIGANSIIQALGGVYIGNNVTLSAGCKIYSLSNYPIDEKHPNIITYANYLVKDQKKVSYIVSPIVIEDNVWIALDCLVLGGTVGKNSFITSRSLVLYDIPQNSYASGSPAKKTKDRFKLKKAMRDNLSSSPAFFIK